MAFKIKPTWILAAAWLLAGAAGIGGTLAFAAEDAEATVAADTFIALCEEANSSVELAEVEALLGQAEGQRGIAAGQLETAEADLAAAFEGLTEVGLSQLFTLEKAISDKQAEADRLNAEISVLGASFEGQSGDALNEAMQIYRATIAERDAAAEEAKQLQATHARLNKVVRDAQAGRDTDMAAAANALIEVVGGLGVSATIAFSIPIAQWTAAKVFLAAASATDEAAVAAVDCIGTRVATLREAEGGGSQIHPQPDDHFRQGDGGQVEGGAGQERGNQQGLGDRFPAFPKRLDQSP